MYINNHDRNDGKQKQGETMVVKLLLREDASPTIRDNKGHTALDLALEGTAGL